MPSILIVEDDALLRMSLARLFSNHGYDITEASDFTSAKTCLNAEIYDLVLTDLRLGPDSGVNLLVYVKKTHHETEVIIMTAYGSVESAVDAIQNGASDYITKPFKNEELIFKANKALERLDLKTKVRYLRQEVAQRFGFDNIIGNSKMMDDLKKMVSRIAVTDISVLITGESGTGKELFAKVIHHHSERRNKPLVPLNCSAIPENLIESELFGHVKGAFTSASCNKRGLFEEADGGTIFLDEVGDLPYAIQAKLLRVLQEKEIRPVGGTTIKTVDARIIAATNVDLERKVRDGQFREDLFYRLNVMPLHIPPLRERPEDIPPLVDYFLRRIQHDYKRGTMTLMADALEMMIRHSWPGNIRELENTLRRAIALSGRDQIHYEDIIFISARTQERVASQTRIKTQSLKENQRQQILRSLEQNNWNYSITANRLGIGRTTLWRKIKKYNLKQGIPEIEVTQTALMEEETPVSA